MYYFVSVCATGTGTAIGDPTEVSALGATLGRAANAPRDVFIGSVKTNIGHLEAAAGVAGLIKVLLMIKHGLIVPSLWYTKDNENPKLNLSKLGLVVPTTCIKWDRRDNAKRIACVNSFGFGGTNAHAIVEEYHAQSITTYKANENTGPLPYLVTVSAVDEKTLVANVQHLFDMLKLQDYDLAALSCTSTCKRDHNAYRKAVFGKTQDDLIGLCIAFLQLNGNVPQTINAKRTIFVFCGVGTPWNGMCKSLMKISIFEAEIQKIDTFLKPLTGWAVGKRFQESSDILSDPMVAHIAIFACQVGLAALWNHYGIKPDAVVGQSVGEVAAAYVAGYFDLKSAVRIIYYRSKYLATVTNGGMAVVRNVETKVVQKVCKASNGTLHIAVFNSPSSCTVSGDKTAILSLEDDLHAIDDINPDVINLDVQCAYHSPFVQQAAENLQREVKDIPVIKGSIPIYSTVSGKLETNGIFATSDYWMKNVRMPVEFSGAVKSAVSDTSHNVIIEVGPSPVLRAHIGNILSDRNNYTTLPSMKKGDEIHTLASTMCSLYDLGFDLNWKKITPCQRSVTDIPTYQLRKYRQLYQSPTSTMRNQGTGTVNVNHLYIKQQPQKEGSISLNAEVDEATTKFVFQHVVRGSIMLPGAYYADVGFEIGRALGIPRNLTAISLEFLRPVKIDKGAKTTLTVSTFDQKDETLFHVKHNQVTMCKGWVRTISQEDSCRDRIDIESLKLLISYSGCRRMDRNEMYGLLESMGFQYGPYLRLLDSCITSGTSSLAKALVPSEVMAETCMTTIHPCIMDAMMQSTVITMSEELHVGVQSEHLSFLPVCLGDVRVLRKPERQMFIYTKRVNTTMLETVLMVHYNILLVNYDGTIVADLRNYTTYSKRNAAIAPCELNYHITWHPFELKPPDILSKPTILVLSNAFSDEFETFVDGKCTITFQRQQDTTNALYIEQTFTDAMKQLDNIHSVDAVLLFIGNQTDHDVQPDNVEQLHNTVKDNCMLVTELVNRMTKTGMKSNLYVVTQNTQATFPIKSSSINILGGELWGYVRSVFVEFIHGDITLIDLQPCFADTKDMLIRFIENTCRHTNATNTEVVIHCDKLYGIQLTKVPKKQIIPSLRDEKRITDMNNIPYSVLASHSKQLCSTMISPQLKHSTKQEKQNVTIHTKSVCVHPLSVFPRTISGKNLDQDIWSETTEEGHQIFGLEYTGYIAHERGIGRLMCKTSKVQSEYEDFEHQWEFVVLHPAEICTTMSVPSDCTVSLKDVPFYQPGLLLYTMLFWKMVCNVPKHSSVTIYCQNQSAVPVMILKKMLQIKKNSYIIDLSENVAGAERRFDILIPLEYLDSGIVTIDKYKTIICLEDCIAESVKQKVSYSAETKLVCLNVVKELERRKVSKTLPKIVSWLQKYYSDIAATSRNQSFSADQSENMDSQCNIPCPTIDVMTDNKTCIPVRNQLEHLFSRDGVYIITGGLTGLGWELLQVIAHMGAGIVISMSRRNASSERIEDIKHVEERTGCMVICIKADVTDLNSIQRAMKEIEERTPIKSTVKGVFHGAGVIQPNLVADLDESKVEYVLKPKVIGTLNLHIATKAMNLDYFVVASSINSLVGSPGQCSYGAANCFMDVFMEWRRRKGLAGQSINWGALSVGMASRPEFTDNFTKRGFNLLSVAEIRSCFQQAMMQNSTNIVFANINWDVFAEDFNNHKSERIRLHLSILIDQMVSYGMSFDNADNMTFDIETLKLSDEATQIQAITLITEKLAGKLIGDISQFKTASTLAEMAFDSMSTVTFINIVHDLTGYRIAASYMMNTSHTMGDVVNLLHEAIFKDTSSHDEEYNTVM